jgi:DNA-binding transcriptional LysR family regulator
MQLTDAGIAFQRVCVKVLAELEEAEHALGADRAEPTGRLRIDLPVTFGRLRVLPIVLPFFQRHPTLKPTLSFTDRFIDLSEEAVDVAVRIGGPDSWPPDLGHTYLGYEKKVFCASPSYLEKHGVPATVEALTEHNALVYGKADGNTSPWLVRHGEGIVEHREVDARIVLRNAEALVDAAVSGLGIAQLATWLIDRHLSEGSLVSILPNCDTNGLALNLVWPRGKQLLPKVSSLLTELRENLRVA